MLLFLPLPRLSSSFVASHLQGFDFHSDVGVFEHLQPNVIFKVDEVVGDAPGEFDDDGIFPFGEDQDAVKEARDENIFGVHISV